MGIGTGFDTITFPQTYIKPGGDYIQLLIKIANSSSGDNAYTAVNEGCYVKSYGRLRWEYNLDDSAVVPGNMTFKILDVEKFIHDYFFDQSMTTILWNETEAELYLNGTLEWSGYLIEDTVDWDDVENIMTFTFTGMPDEINNWKLKLDDDTFTNPLGYTLPANSTTLNSGDPTFEDIIGDIYSIVNSSIAVEFIHEWQGLIYDLETYHDILTFHVNPKQFFGEGDCLGCNNLGDTLKLLCTVFGAYTGLINKNQAFFKQLFRYGSETQTVTVLKLKRKFIPYTFLTYIRYGNTGYTTAELGDEEDAGNIYKFSEQEVPFLNWVVASTYGTCMWHTSTSYYLIEWYDPGLTGDTTDIFFWDHIVKYWWKYRKYDYRNTRFAEFELDGLDVVFYEDFTYDSKYYNIWMLEKNFDTGTSLVHAMELAHEA